MERTDTTRRFRRWTVEISGYVEVDTVSHYCTITDISPGGARVRLLDVEPLDPGTEVRLDLEGYGSIPAEVRHSVSGVLGLMFLLDDAEQTGLGRWLVSANLDRPDTRYAYNIQAFLRATSGAYACVVTDLSRTGAGITVPDARGLAVSDEVVLTLPGHAPMAALIRYIVGDKIGLTLIDGYEGRLPPGEMKSEKE